MEDLVEDLMVVVMMIKRIRMRLEVEVRTRGETILIISMIKEEEDKDLEEEASVKNGFTKEKKGIKHLNVSSAKEGKIKEKNAK